MLPMLGAATAHPGVSASRLAALALVAVAFHLFAYVLNDVVDLPLDRTEPLRADSPLVRGLVRPGPALGFALVQVPLALGLHVWLGGRTSAAAVLAAGLLFMTAYNLYGKRLPVPPISDAVQGLGWVALALYGALMTGLRPGVLTAVLAALVFVYVLMINGIHGGLRDLANDRRHGARTTAIFLGGRLDREGRLVVPVGLVGYGVLLKALLLGLALWCLIENWPRYGRLAWHVTFWAVIGAHAALATLAWQARRHAGSRPDLIRAGILHLVVSLGSIALPFALFMEWRAAVAVLVVYVLPVLIMVRHDGLRWT